MEQRLLHIYDKLYAHFGARHWWPGDTPFEVIVGAILTQSVSWKNVEKAIHNLKQAGLLNVEAIHLADEETIAQLIVPTLYYRMKARKLKAFVNHLVLEHDRKLESLFSRSLGEVRQELLSLYGIGPETADSILLYAGNYPTFVVDKYTWRIFHHLGIFPEEVTYDEMRDLFMDYLEADVPLYNEYHALIVALGNNVCLARKPKCELCPLCDECHTCG